MAAAAVVAAVAAAAAVVAAAAAAALPDRKCHAMHLFSSLSFVRTYNHPTTVPRGAVLYTQALVHLSSFTV